MLVGRDAERDTVAGLLERAANHSGGALVVRGAAGIGKSALLAAAVTDAADRGLRVMTTTAFQAEIHVPYAGLDRFTVDGGESSPAAARVRAAVTGAGESEPHRVAMALLDLLTSDPQPLLVVVEDAQWLDQPSWDSLVFVSRRLASDPVALLIAMRDGPETGPRLAAATIPDLLLEPLADAPARSLLDHVAPGIPPSLRERVLADAAGNPLGLVEFGAAAARRGAGALLSAWLPLTTRVEQTFVALVAELPAPSRTLLLVAAIDDGDDLAEILAATSLVLGAAQAGDLDPAVAAGLVTVREGRLRFRHPLLRSALRQAASNAQRVQVHAALAQVTGADPDRRVWHRAAAALGPDENLARDLSAASDRATRRGDMDVAITALERAVQLSEEPAERASRMMTALDRMADRGDLEGALRVLAQIDEEQLRPPERARLGWFREGYLGGGWSGTARMVSFVAAVNVMREQGSTEMAFDVLASMAIRFYWTNPEPQIRALFLSTVDRFEIPPDHPRLLNVLACVATVRRGAAVLDRLTALRHRTDMPPYELFELGNAANAIGAFDLAAELLAPSIEGLRAQRRLGALVQALMSQAFAAAQLAETRAGLLAAAECRALAPETGQMRWAVTADLARAQVEALRGNTSVARELADQGEAHLLPVGAHAMLALVQLVRGIADLAEGHHREGFDHLHRIFDPSALAHHPYFRLHVLGLLAEAAVHSGRYDELARIVDELEPEFAVGRSPALGIVLSYARALLAPNDEAESRFEAALATDLSRWPFERGRLQLAYGAWLRRRRRPAECRPHLRAAAAVFDGLGVTPWADRARSELAASGETLRRTVDRRDQLTPQELQIAQLAAGGLSNREIAERLFVSQRTVTTHLYRIYPKLGISSRAELAQAVTTPPG